MADSTQNKLRPPCTNCSKPLLLTRLEPEKPGFELRVYYCAACGASDRVVTPLSTGTNP
jgi:DNA-directed RNA polymerase subunit RPC12/RpoP